MDTYICNELSDGKRNKIYNVKVTQKRWGLGEVNIFTDMIVYIYIYIDICIFPH